MFYSNNDVENQIRTILLTLECPVLDGYQYLKQCLLAGAADSEILNNLDGHLYPQVAEECGSSKHSIESSIRRLIDVWWEGELKNMFKDRPRNKELIVRLVEMVQLSPRARCLYDWELHWKGRNSAGSLLDVV